MLKKAARLNFSLRGDGVMERALGATAYSFVIMAEFVQT